MPKKKMTKTKKVATGVGIGLALAAAAAAVYAFSGEKGGKRRKQVKKWVQDMKREAVQAVKRTKSTSKKAYHDIIDELEKKYRTLKEVNKTELALLAAQLKEHWDHIHAAAQEAQKEVKRASTTAKRRTKSAARKSKKIVKK